jgi:hypothetical protein
MAIALSVHLVQLERIWIHGVRSTLRLHSENVFAPTFKSELDVNSRSHWFKSPVQDGISVSSSQGYSKPECC